MRSETLTDLTSKRSERRSIMRNGIEWRTLKNGKRVAHAKISVEGRVMWSRLPDKIKSQRAAEIERARLLARAKRELRKNSNADSSLGWIIIASRVLAEASATTTPSTADNYEHYVTRFRDHVQNPPAREVTTEQCHAYLLIRRQEGASESTLRKEVSFLRRVFRRAGAQCWESVKPPIEPRYEPRYMTPEDFDALIDVAPPHRCLRYAFLVFGGMRRDELRKMTWADVDLKAGILRIKTAAKGHGPKFPIRTVPICKQLRAAIAAAPGGSGRTPLPIGGPNNWRRDLHNDCAKAGLATTWRIHDLRHTFASWLVQRDVKLQEVQRLLGHTSIIMTQRYAHLAPDHDPKVVAALDAAVPKPKAKVETIS